LQGDPGVYYYVVGVMTWQNGLRVTSRGGASGNEAGSPYHVSGVRTDNRSALLVATITRAPSYQHPAVGGQWTVVCQRTR